MARQAELYIEQGLIRDGYQIESEHHRKERIGEAMIRLGKMTKEQAREVLHLQKEKYHYNKRFGEIALELMYINRATLDEYLGDA